jgi:4'-phosphopantetheinyl transferase
MADAFLMDLPADEVHLWYLWTDAIADPAVLARFESVLSPDERERWQRFSFADGRHQYLVSHGFVREVLSRYASFKAADWSFRPDARGKPAIVGPGAFTQAGRTLCFNLTHTRGLAACVIAWDREVGVDAEEIERQGREVSTDLIRRCLSPEEWACLHSVAPERQRSAFFDYWTLKEAYLKARGFGLSLPLEAITFYWPQSPAHDGPVAVRFSPEVADHAHTWRFERFEPSNRHRIAVAVRQAAATDLRVVCRMFTAT